MDEPTAGMAPRERVALMQLVRRIATERGLAVLFTEHDMDVVFGVADRIVVLARGALIAAGRPPRPSGRIRRCARSISAAAPPAEGIDARDQRPQQLLRPGAYPA